MHFEDEIHKLSARLAVLEEQAGLAPAPHELPPFEPKPDLGPVTTLPVPEAVVTRNPEVPAAGEVGNDTVDLSHTAMVDATDEDGARASEKAGE
jgi:hypothetical protein